MAKSLKLVAKFPYDDPCTSDGHSAVSTECQRLKIMVFCVGAYQQWYQSAENRIWVKNHDTSSPQTFKKMDDSRPRFNFGDQWNVRCQEMEGFFADEMKIQREHPLDSLQNAKNFLKPCKTFRIQRDDEETSDASMSAMTVGANGANEQKCAYFEHSDNYPIWQNYNYNYFRISNGKKSTTEKSWYHPDNLGTHVPSNWNGRITLWDDTFVILFNQGEEDKARARRIARVVSSMLDPLKTGRVNDSNLQKKLANAQAHILLSFDAKNKNRCTFATDKKQYKLILENLGRCSGSECDS